MSILNSILGALTGNSSTGNADPLQAALSGLLTQNGGIEGLMNKFNQGGLSEVFTSWVGLGANQSISADQINKILGSDAVQSLAASMGIDATNKWPGETTREWGRTISMDAAVTARAEAVVAQLLGSAPKAAGRHG
jgi:hypothetical protein